MTIEDSCNGLKDAVNRSVGSRLIRHDLVCRFSLSRKN